jgi:DNA-binding transcriptional ArsR family regulator
VPAVVGGDAAARRTLARALGSGSTVVGTTRWLLATPSAEVRGELLDLLGAWRDLRLPPPAERALRTALAAEVRERAAATRGRSAVEVVAAVAGGLTYDPPDARSVLLLPAPSVRPIVVVVDDVAVHVVTYAPPLPPDPRERLLGLARALGDDTRLRILELLRDGERTAAALAADAGAPRTTLLHHLAMLRAAGLLTTSVGRNNATYYALRREALADLRAAAVDVLG